jgi:two-component system, chemotaxis family, CheB/CheR fusion protein
MGPNARSLLRRYGSAVLAVTVALGVRFALDSSLGNALPYLLFCLGAVVTAWYAGFGPSVLALGLGILAGSFFFVPPRYTLVEGITTHPLQSGGSLFLGVNFAVFMEMLRAARRRAEIHALEAEKRGQDLEREILQRKQLERELQLRTDALIEADRRKDEFLAMLGHELRNPLAPIRNAVQVLRASALDDRQLRWARDLIDRQLEQLVRLVDDLLDLSRISRGKIALKREPVELTQIIERAVESCRPLFEARHQSLDVVLPTAEIFVEGDFARLGQVIANLLNNAGKYTPDECRVRLTAAVLGDDVVLRIQDNGVGITAQMLPRIFDLFAQAEDTLDRAEGGLGIGLTLVKSLVELHGGTITARSEGLGKGSEFVVRLPALNGTAPPAQPAEDGTASGPTPAGRRVLAVDDNVDAVESLAMLLGLQGHEVRTAYDGPAALAAADAFQPDVILLDIGLPKLDGYEVARRLRQQPAFEKVLLVAVTGYGQAEDRLRANQAGFDVHLVKPADPVVLKKLLADVGSLR